MAPLSVRAAAVAVAAVAATSAAASASSSITWRTNYTDAPNAYTGAALACAEDMCYLTGGFDNSGEVHPSVATFNVSANVWATNLEPLSVGRGGHASVVVWSSPTAYTVWVIAGQVSIESGPNMPANADPNPNPPGCPNCPAFLGTSAVEFYDPAVGFWQTGPYFSCSPVPPEQECTEDLGLSNGMTRLTCAAWGRLIVCLGGLGVEYPDTGGGDFVPSHNIAILDTTDPVNNAWYFSVNGGGPMQVPMMPVSVHQAALAVAGSTLFMVGGGCGEVQGNCGGGVPPPMAGRNWRAVARAEAATAARAAAAAAAASSALPTPFNCDTQSLDPNGAWASNNTLTFDANNITAGMVPVPAFLTYWRCAHGAAVDPDSGALWVFGGSPVDGQTMPETEVLMLGNVSAGWARGPLLPYPVQNFAYAAPTFFNNSRPAGALGGLVVVGPIGGTTSWGQDLVATVVAGYQA